MLVTAPLAEFCTLMIDEIYGELPSRIYASLLMRGRSTIQQLAGDTGMNARQLRHGLALLLQHNLLYYHLDTGSPQCFYDANVQHAYNLTRTGKILEMVEESFGPAAKDVMQTIILTGQARVGDLIDAYQKRIDRVNRAMEALKAEDPFGNGTDSHEFNGDTPPETKSEKKPDLLISSTAQLKSIICRLVDAELLNAVHKTTYESPEDLLAMFEADIIATYPGKEVKGNKAKAEYKDKVAEALRNDRSESKSLKRKLEQNGLSAKRRKLFDGAASANGTPDGELDLGIDPNQVICINYEKCLVDLRNRRLMQFSADIIGTTTSWVYGSLLKLLSKDISRCRDDPIMDHYEKDGERPAPVVVTTAQILDTIKTGLDLSVGLGKVDAHQISTAAAEKITGQAPRKKLFIDLQAEVEGDATSDEEEEEEDVRPIMDLDYRPAANGVNGVNGTHVTNGVTGVNGTSSKARLEPGERRVDRRTQLRQHLLLLSESTQGFVRHCGVDEWTVDFEPLMGALRQVELDSAIENTAGREGIRLVRMLRAKGKLDEKAIVGICLMRKTDMLKKLAEMQKAGFVQTQEVPREAKADVKKSFFLWYFDPEMALERVLDVAYKTMIHSLQVLDMLREEDQVILSLVKRTDVKGQEEGKLPKFYIEKYAKFLKHERMLLAQIHRVDDLVAVLRDY